MSIEFGFTYLAQSSWHELMIDLALLTNLIVKYRWNNSDKYWNRPRQKWN